MTGSEFDRVIGWVAPESRVLDLGCGDGSLLATLRDTRQVHGYGLEIDLDNIARCLEKGVNVIQADLDQGLSAFDDGSFDTVVLKQTLQAMRRPDRLLREMLRVGRQGVVTIPNFGYWGARTQLGLGGRMPVTRGLPAPWYQTENIHLCTLTDFEDLCRTQGIRIHERVVLDGEQREGTLSRLWPSLFGEVAVYRIGST